MSDLNQQFIQCSRNGDISEMEKLLLRGADINSLENGENALLAAVKQNHHNVVKFLIDKGADVNVLDSENKTALFHASASLKNETLKVLLESGAQANVTDLYRTSPLYTACGKGNVEAVKLLLSHGAYIDVADTDGKSALIVACEKGNFDIVKQLLKHRADLDIQDTNGRSALICACENRNAEAIKLLLKQRANVHLQDRHGRSALTIAIGYQNIAIVKLLMKHRANVHIQDNRGRSSLTHAYDIGNTEIIKLLLKHVSRAHINSGLMYSVKKGKIGLAKLLLQSGAHVDFKDSDGRSALTFANEGTAKLLLDHKACIDLQDKNGNTALMHSCIVGEINVAQFLLEGGAQVNLQNENGKTALMLATENRRIIIVILLLKHGADINLQDNNGTSSLMLSIGSSVIIFDLLLENGAKIDLQDRKGRSALIKLYLCSEVNSHHLIPLLKSGANVNLQNIEGKSALMMACQNESVQDIRQLLACNPELNLQDDKGRTSLMLACQNKHAELVSFLLDSGADMRIQNNHGLSAVDIALNSDNTDIIQEFIKPRTMRSFPGILFLEGVKRETLTSSAKDINLEDVGIALSIPEGALSSTDPPLDVQIQPCFSGSWDMPENLELVSPAYIVKPSRKVAFKKEVLVKIWHHANLETEEDCADMEFLSAKTTPEYREGSPVYVFQEITGVKGSFRPREEQPAGEIAVKHFCILGIFRRVFKGNQNADGHLYSARFYTAKESKAIIFCMCLFQPQYIDSCDRGIASLYKERRKPAAKDGVTITAEEVCVEQKCTTEWKTFCKTKPASILKRAICQQTEYEPGDCNLLRYIPTIEIEVTKVPDSLDSGPLELNVEGLNVEAAFQFSPGEFAMNLETASQFSRTDSSTHLRHSGIPPMPGELGSETTKFKAAIEELEDEIREQSLECSESNNVPFIATQMLKRMKRIYKLLQCQDPRSVSSHALQLIKEMDEKGQLLMDEVLAKCTHEMKASIHVESVSFYSRQLKVIYSANFHHNTGDASELFITTAANLMTTIKDVLKALKSAQELPSSDLPLRITPETHPHMPTRRKYSLPLFPHPTPYPHECPQTHLYGYPPPPPSSQPTLHPHEYLLSHTMPQPQSTNLTPPSPTETPTVAAQSTWLSKPLSIEDTGLVYRGLYPLRAKWKTLGTFLHIDHGALQVIKEDNESSDDKLEALMALWLRRIDPPATWQALYEAVQYIDPNQAQQIRGMAEGSDGTVVVMQHASSNMAASGSV